nr:chtb2 [Mamestra brassicae multiple nucleopolyhedrovirus]
MRLSQYVLLVILFVLIIFLLLRPLNDKTKGCPFKLLRHHQYKDVRIDCETGEISLCPPTCQKFDVSKQKCDRSTDTFTDPAVICPPGAFGNVKHPYNCTSYFLCAGSTPIKLYCSDGFCFNGSQCGPVEDGCAAPCHDICEDCCAT